MIMQRHLSIIEAAYELGMPQGDPDPEREARLGRIEARRLQRENGEMPSIFQAPNFAKVIWRSRIGRALAITAGISIAAAGVGTYVGHQQSQMERQGAVDTCVGHLRNLPDPHLFSYQLAVTSQDSLGLQGAIIVACEQADGDIPTAIDNWVTATHPTSTTR